MALGENGLSTSIGYGDRLSAFATHNCRTPGGHPEGYPDAILNAIRAFYASLEHQGLEQRDLEAGYATFEDGHAAALVVAAAHKSHQEGGWIGLENLELSRERIGGMK